MGENGTVSGGGIFFLSLHETGFSGDGHDQDIAHVLASGAAEVGMRETYDRLLIIMVAGAVLPLLPTLGIVGVGAHLHHAEGKLGGRMGVAEASGADERVDK